MRQDFGKSFYWTGTNFSEYGFSSVYWFDYFLFTVRSKNSFTWNSPIKKMLLLKRSLAETKVNQNLEAWKKLLTLSVWRDQCLLILSFCEYSQVLRQPLHQQRQEKTNSLLRLEAFRKSSDWGLPQTNDILLRKAHKRIHQPSRLWNGFKA